MEILLLCIQIFCVRILDVSLGTIKTIIMVKGKTYIASVIGFFEVLIWFMVVKEALNTDITSVWIAVSYAGGYATGTMIGGLLSNKFISGSLTVQVVLSSQNDEIVSDIRKAGYAVTVMDVKGQDTELPKYMLMMEIDKKKMNHIKKLIRSLDERAFIVVNETKLVQNGYFK